MATSIFKDRSMPIQLAWKPIKKLAAVHLAYCAATHDLLTVFRMPENRSRVVLLGVLVKELVMPEDRVWELIFQLSPDCPGNDDLAQRLCVRCLRSEERSGTIVSRISSSLREAELAFSSEYPDYAHEILLRQRPLQEQWEAFGPGLLHQIGNLLGEGLLVQNADVCLVPPVSGGFGWAHLHTNRCHIEAVLTNPDAELTEVLRLAWLVSQLDFERPQFSDRINAFHLRRVAGLAMLPPVLVAAEHLGLSRLTTETLHRAIELWRLQPAGPKALAMAEVLMVWWETARLSQADWALALTGLDRMLADEVEPGT